MAAVLAPVYCGSRIFITSPEERSISMLELLRNEAEKTLTLNGETTYTTSGLYCLDLFFGCGAMRNRNDMDIKKLVNRAFISDPVTTLRILFYARDIRGGLGERRFFRLAISSIAQANPDAIIRNIKYIPEYGRYDDLLVLFGTPCEKAAMSFIKEQFDADMAALSDPSKPVSLLGKWLPSVNASSSAAKNLARRIANTMGLKCSEYRKSISALRKRIAIIENNLRTKDYTFDYSTVPSNAMMKYRKAFIRNDGSHYNSYIEAVTSGKEKLNASVLYPYDIVRNCFGYTMEEIGYLDAAWNNLPVYGDNNANALAVVDGSGSMYCNGNGVRPIDVAISLGIYFAEHNKGKFAGNFITFSCTPQLIKITGENICEKVNFVSTFCEVANTDLEAVFDLLLTTAVKNKVPQKDMPERLYIISDMEFDRCCYGAEDSTLFQKMKQRYTKYGYKLPNIIFWNVNSWQANCPVRYDQTGAALVSGASPSLFSMVLSDDINPLQLMLSVINTPRYSCIN